MDHTPAKERRALKGIYGEDRFFVLNLYTLPREVVNL